MLHPKSWETHTKGFGVEGGESALGWRGDEGSGHWGFEAFVLGPEGP